VNVDPVASEDRRLQQVRMLTEVSRALTYATSLDEVLRLTVQRAASIFQTNRSVLMLAKDGLLSVRAAHGLDVQAAEQFREPFDERLMPRLQRLLGVSADRFLGVPLVVAGEVTGILAIALPEGVVRVIDQEWLLSALADQAAVALEKTRLDQAAEFRERLIGIVSHDLRNPLNAILLGATVLEEEALSPRAKYTVTRVRSSAELAARMIRDLLDYTQAHLGGELPVQKRVTDLTAIVRDVVDDMNAIDHGNRIELQAPDETMGGWDVDRMTQVVGNLLTNALQYSPEGTPVHVQIRRESNHIVLSVHNQGAAIPSDQLSRIFEPMRRATTGTSNSAFRSVGLGLYIVRHLIKAHGGTVSVTSTDAEGTTFTAMLPLS
jgi:signal transduction histidine kinase